MNDLKSYQSSSSQEGSFSYLPNHVRISAFDLDGTLLTCNSSFSLIAYLTRKKVLKKSQFYYCIMRYYWHLLTVSSLHTLHKKIFEHLFLGVTHAELDGHISLFLQKHLDEMLFRPMIDILKQCQDRGDKVCILSSSPSFIVKPIAALWGVDHVVATEYLLDSNSRFREIKSIVDGSLKAHALSAMQGSETVAFSDSIVDLPFLQAAGKAVAVNPDRRLKRFALRNKWEIIR